MTTNYRRGRALEYRVRDRLREDGYFAVMTPGSRTPVDVVAIKPGQTLFVQCKRDGRLPHGQWNRFYDLATQCGAVPVMVEQLVPRGQAWWRLTGLKVPSLRQQPMVEFRLDVVA